MESKSKYEQMWSQDEDTNDDNDITKHRTKRYYVTPETSETPGTPGTPETRETEGSKDLFISSEASSLREELKAVHQAYSIILKSREEENHILKQEISLLEEARYSLEYDNEYYIKRRGHNLLKIKELVKEKEEWIGRTLKYQYLFTQMKKIGLQQSEDIFECFEDIEIPEVSINIRDRFVPTEQTDNIDWTDLIDDIDVNIDVNIDDLRDFSDINYGDVYFGVDLARWIIRGEIRWILQRPLHDPLIYLTDIVPKCIIIQKIFRGHLVRRSDY